MKQGGLLQIRYLVTFEWQLSLNKMVNPLDSRKSSPGGEHCAKALRQQSDATVKDSQEV